MKVLMSPNTLLHRERYFKLSNSRSLFEFIVNVLWSRFVPSNIKLLFHWRHFYTTRIQDWDLSRHKIDTKITVILTPLNVFTRDSPRNLNKTNCKTYKYIVKLNHEVLPILTSVTTWFKFRAFSPVVKNPWNQSFLILILSRNHCQKVYFIYYSFTF